MKSVNRYLIIINFVLTAVAIVCSLGKLRWLNNDTRIRKFCFNIEINAVRVLFLVILMNKKYCMSFVGMLMVDSFYFIKELNYLTLKSPPPPYLKSQNNQNGFQCLIIIIFEVVHYYLKDRMKFNLNGFIRKNLISEIKVWKMLESVYVACFGWNSQKIS